MAKPELKDFFPDDPEDAVESIKGGEYQNNDLELTPTELDIAEHKVTITLPQDVHDALSALARKDYRTISNFIAFTLIKQYGE
jgi:hypothetical protein